MKNAFAVAAALLLALSCAEPYPSVGGSWRYASTLTYPTDFDLAPGQPYVCSDDGVLTIDQSSGVFSGTYDSLTVSCNSGGVFTGFNGTVINGTLAKDGIIAFSFDSPSWLSVGTLHGDSMGGTVTDSVNGLVGMELASGTWKACRGRPCQ